MYFWRISYFVTSSTLRKRGLAGKAFSGMTNGQCMHAAYAQRAFTTSTVLLACHRCLFFSLNRKDRESSAPQVTRQLKCKKRQLKNIFEFSRLKLISTVHYLYNAPLIINTQFQLKPSLKMFCKKN